MARPFFAMPTEYEEGAGEDPLADLTDEQRKRFLEEFNPSPVHTGAMTRGAQGFAPLPSPRGALAPDREGLVASAPPPADDLMSRFMAAQQKGAGNAAFANLGGRLDNYARVFAGIPERQVETDAVRARPAQELMQAEGLKQQERQRTRQTELDAVSLDKTRAETTKAQASARATEADEKREAALADPKSPESASLRDTASALLKDSRGESMIPHDKLEAMSGVQIRDALKFGTSQINAESMAGYRQAQLEQQGEQSRRDAALRAEGLAIQEYIANLNVDSAEARAEAERDLREKLAKMDAEAKVQAAGRERGEKLGERAVGGFEFNEGRTPSPDGAKKMAAVAEQSRKIQRGLGRLRELYKQYGTELFKEHAGEMESEFTSVTTALRIMNEMGVPNGRDYEFLAKELADPTAWRDLFTSTGRNLSKLDVLTRRVDDSVGITADVYGYRRAGGGATKTGTAANPAPPGGTYESLPSPALPARPKPVEVTNPANSPATAPVQKLKPGQKLVDVVPEGEFRKVPMGNGEFRIVVKRNGTLKIVEVKNGNAAK